VQRRHRAKRYNLPMPADQDDPFYLSDLMSELDGKIPFDMMGIMERMHYPLALLCVDASGEESLYAGYVKNVSYQVLEIANFDERQFTLPLGGADFYSLERKQAPASLKAITTDAYWYGSSFHTGKKKCYLLARMAQLATPALPPKA
jgi:hypothetical protein